MTEQVDIFFDYVCPYCFVACRREEILKRDLEVEFNWKGWEIFPDRSHECVARDDLRCEETVARLGEEIGLTITMPPYLSNSRSALMGLEFARKKGKSREYHREVFDLHWVEKRDISDIGVLKEACSRIGLDPAEFELEIVKGKYERILEGNDNEAERIGIQLVPSYVLGRKIVVGNVPLASLKKELEEFLRS